MTVTPILIMISYAFLNGTGSFLVKVGLNKIEDLEKTLGGLLRNIFRTFYYLLKTPLFVLGFIISLTGFLIYQYALSLYNLSLVKPLQSLSIIFVLFWGFLYFKEKIDLREKGGIIALLVGSFLVSFYVSEKSVELNFNNLVIFSIIILITCLFSISVTTIKKDKKVDEYFLAIASGLLFSLGMIFNNALIIFEIENSGGFLLSFQLLVNPYLYLLVISYFFAEIVLLAAVNEGRLSIAASTISCLTYGLPILGAFFIFNENPVILFDNALIFPLSFFKLIGIIFIFGGLLLLYPRLK
ncbi:MAG: EamA family transporter [Candidatus Helarchaeota archaeon]